MNVIIPPKRRDKKTSFKKLVNYVSTREDKKNAEVVTPDSAVHAPGTAYVSTPGFGQLVDYVGRKSAAPANEIVSISPEGIQRVLSGEVLCETNCFSLDTAASEMNLTASQNRHCKDAVYHFILSWQGEEDPSPDAIFRSVRYSLKQLGMEDHQYVAAIHRDTDNVHCHVSASASAPDSPCPPSGHEGRLSAIPALFSAIRFTPEAFARPQKTTRLNFIQISQWPAVHFC